MTNLTATLHTGQTVKVGAVESQLTELWRQIGGEAVVRAATLNLIVDSDQPDEVLRQLEQIAQRHPCRAIVLTARGQADRPLTATPELLVTEEGHVTCEVIALEAGEGSAPRLASSAEGLIVADQMTFLWRTHANTDGFTSDDPTFTALAGSLDGLVIDSAAIAGETAALRTVSALADHKLPQFRGCVYDLAWLRLRGWRQGLAQLFDPAEMRKTLYTATNLTITTGRSAIEAWLLLGWLADRLDWQLAVNPAPAPGAGTWLYTAHAANRSIAVQIKTIPSAVGLQQIGFQIDDTQYSVTDGDDCLTLRVADQPPRVVSSTVGDVSGLVGLALDADGCDPLYMAALQRLIPLIGELTPLRSHAGIVVAEDSTAVSEAACQLIVEAAAEAIAAHGRFSLSLSGGTTPRVVYERLTTEPYRSALNWSNIHLFWGDERNVSIGHPDSNQGMTKAALIDRVPIPPENIHWITAGEADAAQVAANQATDIRSFFAVTGDDLPHFDLILLGMGEDGHTASLFPHTAALTANDADVFISNVVPQLNTTRLTLTAGVINAARQVVFLIAGAKKADILHEVIRGPYLPDDHPSQRIQPIDGQLTFLLDRAAAAKL